MSDRQRSLPIAAQREVMYAVYYFDADWELIEELVIEDATLDEATEAVHKWMRYRACPSYNEDHFTSDFPKVHSVSVEVYLG